MVEERDAARASTRRGPIASEPRTRAKTARPHNTKARVNEARTETSRPAHDRATERLVTELTARLRTSLNVVAA